MKSPTDGAPRLQSKNSNGLLLFDEEDGERSISGDLSDIGEDSIGESEPVTRKRLRKSAFDDKLDDDSDDHGGLFPKVESRKISPRSRKRDLEDANEEVKSITVSERPKIQEAFQPGSTPVQDGK